MSKYRDPKNVFLDIGFSSAFSTSGIRPILSKKFFGIFGDRVTVMNVPQLQPPIVLMMLACVKGSLSLCSRRDMNASSDEGLSDGGILLAISGGIVVNANWIPYFMKQDLIEDTLNEYNR